MNNLKPNDRIHLWCKKSEKEIIINKAKDARMSLTQFVLKKCLEDDNVKKD